MDAKKLLIGSIIFLLAATACAGTDQEAADTLYRYYQADMDEDLEAMTDLVDSSIMAADEREEYMEGMRNLIAALFESYDTESFELTDADLFSDGVDAKIIYHLKASIKTSEGEQVDIDNDFVALLHDEGSGWKVTYVMPKESYEQRRMALTYVEADLEDTVDYIGAKKDDVKAEDVLHDEGGGLFDFIWDLIQGIIDFITWLFEDEEEPGVVCDTPYIRCGGGCCLDQNSNGVCDIDEKATTTYKKAATPTTAPDKPTSTTLPPTTTSTTTSTTAPEIACSMNSDCGEQREVRVCYKGDVYLKRISPICKHPGSIEAQCMQLESWVTGTINKAPTPTEVCGHGCYGGECLNT